MMHWELIGQQQWLQELCIMVQKARYHTEMSLVQIMTDQVFHGYDGILFVSEYDRVHTIS